MVKFQAITILLIFIVNLRSSYSSNDYSTFIFKNLIPSKKTSSAYNHRRLAFGDYVDPTFNCPATTTCPIVCVANASRDCPSDSQCDADLELCADGTCSTSCDPELESPCECETLPQVCAKKIDVYPNCFDRFQEFYDTNTQCIEDQEEALPSISMTNGWFVAFYFWIALITSSMLLWCSFNQRMQPVEGSTQPLECAKHVASFDQNKQYLYSGWTQTAYKGTFTGMLLYACTIFTHLLIQFLLLLTTIYYYMQQEAIERWEPVFYDEVEVLLAFEIIWMIGFVWCFFLKYPVSIKSLYLRRCLSPEATYVAVHTPAKSVDPYFKQIGIVNFLSTLGKIFTQILSFLYSDASQHNRSDGLRTKVTFCEVHLDEKTKSRYFYFHMRRYVYDEKDEKFKPATWEVGKKIGDLLSAKDGITSEEALERQGQVGPNTLNLNRPTIIGCIANEFSKPFYLYQNFMVWTWAPYWYYYMAIVHTVVRVTGGIVVSIFQYINDSSLYKLMVVQGEMQVLRDDNFVTMSQTDIVPGDIVKLQPGLTYCDMAVIKAQYLLLDESALTGEVHPVSKVQLDPALSEDVYNTKTHKSSTISAGTTIVECNIESNDLAVVTKTGSFTAKGELLCDVLSYERHQFKFDTQVKLVLVILVLQAIIMFAVAVKLLEDQWVYAWFYGMFIVGTVIPPLLPTVFVVSVGISAKRLQMDRITCTDSKGILVAGKVRHAFFDKTGTLTKQGLDFLSAEKGDSETETLLQEGIAVCHTLEVSALTGNLVGNTVDKMSFGSSGLASLNCDDGGHVASVTYSGKALKYLKRFEFDHHLMTQSVILEDENKDQCRVFVKGSPEAIKALCTEKTIPANFYEKTKQSAREGIYQLAIATRTYNISPEKITEVVRNDIEQNLTFVGFINFQNALKEETPTVLEELTAGDIVSTMVTGDNVLTGIYIAKQSGLVNEKQNVIIGSKVVDGQIEWISDSDDHILPDPKLAELQTSLPDPSVLAMTGEVWNHLLTVDPKMAIEYAKFTRVFGRCTPNDKVTIVTTFVDQGEITLMCGDGGNDCGALKAAHVGIALSDAEASIVAPFTSLDKTISSVTQVLKEGRCALASAFAAYKYMIMYGQVESFNQLTNAYFFITFSDWNWVWMDGIWVITMAFTLPLARAAKKLSTKRPTSSLLGPHTLFSAIGVLIINFLFLVISIAVLRRQDWYQCRKWTNQDVSNIATITDNYEASVIFIITGYQYVSSAAAFNFGYSFRAKWFENYVFVFFFSGWTILHFVATLTASKASCIFRLNCTNDNVVPLVTNFMELDPIYNAFNTTVMPMTFRWLLAFLMALNLFLICAWDYFFVNKFLPKLGKTIDIKADKKDHVVEDKKMQADEQI